MTDRSVRIAALIVKSLQNDLSGPEEQELQEWIGESESNRLFFERFKDEDYLLQNLKRHAEARRNAEAVRAKLDALIAGQGHPPVYQIDRKRFTVEKIVAAAVLIPVIIGICYFGSGHSSEPAASFKTEISKIFTPIGKMATFRLGEGSSMSLDASSAASYLLADNFREAKVDSGQVFFTIKKDPARPFTVNVRGQKIEVLGTSFNVNTYDGHTKITLKEGKVKIISPSGSVVVLSFPGQQAELDSLGQLRSGKDVGPERVDAWMGENFEFNDDIHTIMKQLSRWYGFEFKGDMDNKYPFASPPISKKASLETILSKLKQIGPVDFKKEGNMIIVIDTEKAK